MSTTFMKELEHPDILLLGDSIMYHIKRFPHLMEDREVCNLCVPGQKSWQLHENLDFVKDKATDVIPSGHPYRQTNVRKIIVHIGTNDLPLFMEHPGSISARLIHIVELIKDRIQRTSPPGSKSVYLLGLLPRQHKNDTESFMKDIEDINSILEGHFRGQGIYIKPPCSLVNADRKIVDQSFHTDKLHLSEKGLQEIFKTIFHFVDDPYNNVIKRYKSRKQLEESLSRRLRRRRLAEPSLVWCDNRGWSDWVF